MFKKSFVKNILSIIILSCMLISILPAKANAAVELEPVPELASESAVIYSVDSKKMLISTQGANIKYYPMAVAKLMTAVLAVENADITSDYIPKDTEMVTVGKEILTLPTGYNSAGFEVGDVVSLPDLIRAAIIGNADDAAITIGAYIGRKKLGGVADSKYNYDKAAIDYFVTLMNRRASLAGISQTSFSNCTGAEGGSDSHSNVGDMAKIASIFLNYKFLRDIASIYSYDYWGEDALTFSDDSSQTDENDELPEEDPRHKAWTSSNQLINPDSEYYYQNCKGLMAWQSSEDQMFIVAYAEYHDINAIAVVMGSDPQSAYADIINMFEYVFNNYVMHTFIEDGQVIAQYNVKNAMDPSNEQLKVCAEGGGKYLSRIDQLDFFGFEMRLDSKYYVPTEENLYEEYISPEGGIVKGDKLGTLDIYYNTVYIDTVVLYAGNTVPVFKNLPEPMLKKWYHNVDWSTVFLIALVLFLIICIFILTVSIANKLKRQRVVRQKYSLSNNQKRPAVHYNRKKQIK